MTLYGDNIASGQLRFTKPSTNFRKFGAGEVKHWWCPTCELGVSQVKDPVSCDDCGGDMTFAPMNKRPKGSK